MQTFCCMNTWILETGDIDDDEYPRALWCHVSSPTMAHVTLWHYTQGNKMSYIASVSSKYGIQTNVESMGFVSHFSMTSWHKLHNSWGRGWHLKCIYTDKNVHCWNSRYQTQTQCKLIHSSANEALFGESDMWYELEVFIQRWLLSLDTSFNQNTFCIKMLGFVGNIL